MTDKSKTPDRDNKEFKEEMRQYAKDAAKELFDPDNAPDFEEKGVLGGSEDLLKKSDAELFPDEQEEHTPEERREKFKVHKNEPSEPDNS